MKKQIFLFLFLFCGAMIAQGQETYYVLSKSGKVQVYVSGKDKKEVVLSQSLSENNKLWISKEADLQLRDKSGHIYSLSGVSGDWYVYDFIKKAKSNMSNGFLSQFTKGMMKVLKKTPETTIQRNLGTRRGSDDTRCFEDTVYASLCEYKKFTTFGVVFEKIKEDNGLIWFRVKNESSDTFYCNIIREDADGRMFVCYESGWFNKYDVFPLSGNTTVEMKAFPLWEESQHPCSYILIRSKKPFRVDALQALLDKGEKPSPNASSSSKVDCVKAR